MIISALSKYYDLLAQDESVEIPDLGFSFANVSFELNIDSHGRLMQIVPLQDTILVGKKEVSRPKMFIVPQQIKKSSGTVSNFLCENAEYVLGLPKEQKKINKTEERHKDFIRLHHLILDNQKTQTGEILLKFLDSFRFVDYMKIIEPYQQSLNEGGNIVFRINGKYVHEDEEIKKLWLGYKKKKESSMIKMQCSVLGEDLPIAITHPSIKGVKNAQSSGASIVSFNERAYESYNKEKKQGLNAPISEIVTFKYTTALNYLLSSFNQKLQIGDATTVFWAESKEERHIDFMNFILNPTEEKKHNDRIRDIETEDKIRSVLRGYIKGEGIDYDALNLDSDVKFCILGLSPNAARISIRFFYMDKFSNIVDKLLTHYHDMAIEKQFKNQMSSIPLWMLINETRNPKSKDNINPLIGGSVMRSIISGGMYPRILYNTIINRIRCDKDSEKNQNLQINYIRVSIIKAYLSRYARIYNQQKFKEVFTMSLNENATNAPYLLGRLFAVLEKAQKDANPGINATIKDRYFSSACATPANVFPTLLRLAQTYISKADYGYVSESRISEIMEMIEKPSFPAHLTLEEQGVFIIGYYHQSNSFYKKSEKIKENNENV